MKKNNLFLLLLICTTPSYGTWFKDVANYFSQKAPKEYGNIKEETKRFLAILDNKFKNLSTQIKGNPKEKCLPVATICASKELYMITTFPTSVQTVAGNKKICRISPENMDLLKKMCDHRERLKIVGYSVPTAPEKVYPLTLGSKEEITELLLGLKSSQRNAGPNTGEAKDDMKFLSPKSPEFMEKLSELAEKQEHGSYVKGRSLLRESAKLLAIRDLSGGGEKFPDTRAKAVAYNKNNGFSGNFSADDISLSNIEADPFVSTSHEERNMNYSTEGKYDIPSVYKKAQPKGKSY